MPLWPNKSQTLVSRRTPSTWTETVAIATEKTCIDPHTVQSARSTVVDDSLPLPVQACVNNSVSRRRGGWGPCTSTLAASWVRFKRRLVPETVPSAPSCIEGTLAGSTSLRVDGPSRGYGGDGEEVDEIVVNRTWSEELKGSASRSITHSDLGTSPEISDETCLATSLRDRESLASRRDWTIRSPLVFLRWRLWPIFVELFCPKFENEKSEQNYSQVRQFFVGERPHRPYICF